MNIPADRQTWETAIATFWWDDEGFLMSSSKPVRRTVENCRENFELVAGLTGGKPACHIVRLTRSPMPDAATRAFVNAGLPKAYKAMAMIADSALSKLIMNFLFGLKPAPIPMKTFSNEADAKAWMRGFLAR